eukprot:13361843-Alexandrium_andersonii.AAC.1
MSASLVGSEMCIRDRLSAATPGVPAELCHLQLGRVRLGGHLRAAARRRNAVSYTHLTLPTICSV